MPQNISVMYMKVKKLVSYDLLQKEKTQWKLTNLMELLNELIIFEIFAN